MFYPKRNVVHLYRHSSCKSVLVIWDSVMSPNNYDACTVDMHLEFQNVCQPCGATHIGSSVVHCVLTCLTCCDLLADICCSLIHA